MNERFRILLIRSVFLFLLSMMLVAGFWFHGQFYQIGFTNLLIIGGFVTFLVIWAARLAMSGELPRGPAGHNRTAVPGQPGSGLETGPGSPGLPAAPGDVPPTGRAHGKGATGSTDLAAPPLPVGVDDGGPGWILAGVGLLAAGGTAGGVILQPVIRRRRRRRGRLYY